ncbi:MAG TPA: TIGR04551 family protein [Labilithrix sp.]|nr:TIGR04551 family protein [Labilithrix sp.]
MVFRRHRFLGVVASAALALVSGTARAQATDPPAGGSGSQPSGGPARSGDPKDNLIPGDPASGAAQSGTPAVDPAGDQAKLLQQGRERPTGDGTIGSRPSEVYSEDWWAHTRPILELHGYFRTRAELYHNFSLGRPGDVGAAAQNLWPQPLDNSYLKANGEQRQVLLCGDDGKAECGDKSQASANLRLRLNPEIHVSDNLRVMAQVDLLDNLVLGSTPDSYAMRPSGKGSSGYSPQGYNGYAPLGAFSTTQGPPTAGVNGYRNSIDVQRAWAEYLTPLGQIRFGRMPSHWGLGMLVNSGDGIDHDYQSNADRLMFVSGIKSMDLYFGGAWDFVSSGTTSASPYDVYGGQPYNTSNRSNVSQWVAFAAHRTNPELQRLKLARNDVVLNGGIYAVYRKQEIDVQAGETPMTSDTTGTTPNNGFERRGAEAFIPDVWVQFLWNKLRIEAEAASIWGSIENSPARNSVSDPVKLRSWGLATQAELRAVEDKLRVQFGAGWASGDQNVEGLNPGSTGLQGRLSEGAISSFRFHPSYQIDYIFFRKIMTRVQNAYYFRPSVEYDFIRNPNGQKLGGGAAIIWSRASEFTQTPGNKRDLGVELDLQVYYQSKDGNLNDDPTKLGGFYSAIQYGVFFPLGGLDYLAGESSAPAAPQGVNFELSTAQTVRLIMGVLF